MMGDMATSPPGRFEFELQLDDRAGRRRHGGDSTMARRTSKELTLGTMAYRPAALGKFWFVPSFDAVLAGTRSERMKGRVLLQFQRGLAAPEYRLCPWTSERSIAIS